MLPVTALQQIVVIPGNAFEPYDIPNNPRRHKYLEFYPEREYTAKMIIAPHHHEAWLNVHLFKIALFCRANRIKLISIGHENQLPFFGAFSDAVILQEGPLNDMFGWYSTFSTDTSGFKHLNGWLDVYRHDDLPWDGFPVKVEDIIPDAGARFRSPWRAIYGHYSAEHVLGVFSECNIFVQESARELFEKLNAENGLPRDALWCEVKERFGKVNPRLAQLQAAGVPLVGLDKSLQKQLVREHGPAFMTLQILSSLYNNCRMVLGAGSAHVFAVAPANIALAVAPADRFYSDETAQLVRKFNLHRFGAVPYVEEATLTWMCTEDERQYSTGQEDENIAHWQVDYFLTEAAMRAYLTCALAIPPRTNVSEVSWAEFRAQRACDAFMRGQFVRFRRNDGQHLCDLLLQSDGTIFPGADNEKYWSQVGPQLALKTHLGQTSTVLRPTQRRGKLSGPFIYNQSITHELEQIQ
jgi:hypothetical protein